MFNLLNSRSLSIVKKFRPKTLTKCHPKLIKTSSKLNTLFQCVSPVIELPDKSYTSQQQSATLLTSASSPSPSPNFIDNPLHISNRSNCNNDHKDFNSNFNVTTDDDEEDDEVQSVSTLCEEWVTLNGVTNGPVCSSYYYFRVNCVIP